MNILRFALIAVVVGQVFSAHAQQDRAQQWLDRMALAVDNLSYRGTLVQMRANQIEAYEVIRRVSPQGIDERIYALNGPKRELVRNGNQMSTNVDYAGVGVLPGFQQRLMPNQPLSQLARLEDAYELTLGEIERVADHEAQRIDIRPKDGFRYGQRLWLEVNTGMLLRSVTLSPQGQSLGEQVFVTIDIGAQISDREISAATPTAPISSSGATTSNGLSEDITKTIDASPSVSVSRRSGLLRPLWGPKQVPQFYHLVDANHGRSRDNTAFDHLLFSDGLSSFSIYIDHAPVRPVGTKLEAVGSVHILSGMMGLRQFTIMGQVPAETVEYVGRQLVEANGIDPR